MDNIPPYFVKEYARDFRWTVDENGAICTYGRRPDFTRDKFLVPEKELVEKHPLFPLAIRALIVKNRELGRSTNVEAAEILATLDVLLYGAIELTDKNGVDHIFSEVQDLALLRSGDVDVTATSVAVEKVSYNNIDVVIAHSTMYWCFTVSANELETRYPGWHGKWAIGDELEVPYPELMRMVFTKNAEQNIASSLPDFTL